jgi:ABC-type transport system involved in multi-copper enzyme maturation permease subunit
MSNSAQPFDTLCYIELRKTTDTRSGRWILAVIFVFSLLALIWVIAHPEIQVSFHEYSDGVASTVVFIAPIIGLLAITSEWTQRTALTTFTLTPRRWRVLAAKYVATIAMCVSTIIVGLLLAACATAIGGLVHGHASFDHMAGDVRGDIVVIVLQGAMAAGFGSLAGQTPLALGAFLAAPTAFASVSTQLLGGLSPWFDIFETYSRLWSRQPFDHLGQTLTSIACWILIPGALGAYRTIRREVK